MDISSVIAITASISAKAYYEGRFIALTVLCPYSTVGPSVYPVHCTLYRVHSLKCTVRPPLRTLHCTVYSPVNIVYSIVTYISHGRTERYSFRLDITNTTVHESTVCITESVQQNLYYRVIPPRTGTSHIQGGLGTIEAGAGRGRCCQKDRLPAQMLPASGSLGQSETGQCLLPPTSQLPVSTEMLALDLCPS